MAFSSEENKQQLLHLFSIQPNDNSDKIDSVKTIFNTSGASKDTQDAIANYTEIAFETLEKMKISEDKKMVLRLFGEKLMNRKV
jgi:geranylgeranyl diphosphate synthase type II